MRLFKIFGTIFLALVVCFTVTGKSFSWSLFQVLISSNYEEQNPKSIFEWDPEKDIKYLPSPDNKTLFEAVNDLSIFRKKEVRKYVYLYLTKGREYVIQSISRSHVYMGIIEQIIKNHPEIPADIALLPLLESGYNPYAVSRSNATGLWQFLCNTSRLLGLKMNRWTDERRDIEKSTLAALKHLKNMHRIFNSWELALAAYNGGAGHVKRTMIRTGTKNLWDLAKTGRLRKETSEYVPRFAALMVIYKNQSLFGLTEEIETAELMQTKTIVLKYPINLHKLSEITGTSTGIIYRFNPELKSSITPPYEKNYSLRLPQEAIEKLEELEEKPYILKFRRLMKHTVRKGECIRKIARRYRSTIGAIILVNNIKNPAKIRIGQKLYIPI